MNRLGYGRVSRNVIVVPDPTLDVRGDIGGVMDLGLLSCNDGPTALGLDTSHGR